ncbi:MAG TPA: hypothetical protein VOA87_08685, partial [Thermoanaerobaculia bacterium]|nr:hypothetical protein [Thermoanaerobaculia bacterium]
LPTLREMVASFQHEAFPPLFPLLVRAYSQLTGGGDAALRAFGLAVVLGLAGVLWWNARTTARTVPLLSLALLGLDAPFLILAGSLRGYGLGSALVLLTYGLLAKCLAEPPRSPGVKGGIVPALMPIVALAALAAIASVQVVLGNAALVLALCAAGAAVALARRRFALAAAIAGCGAAAALSLLPYAPQLAAARRQWSMIVVYPIGWSQIVRTLAATLGPRPVAFVWLLLVAVGLTAVVREVRRRRAAAEPGADVATFAGLTIVGALAVGVLFSKQLGYTPRPWYFLPLAALLASALDTLFGALLLAGGRGGRRLASVRLAAAALLAAAQVAPLAQSLTLRQTNADLVAHEVAKSAAREDLVVVEPWYYGVSFNRYYDGQARWLTLPEIPDHRIHRYDLLKVRLADRHPLDDLLQTVAATLRSGHRVWLVGDARWPRPGEPAPARPPAPLSPDGWHDKPYLDDWSLQLGEFLESHGALAAAVAVPPNDGVNALEDLPLAVVSGWRPAPPLRTAVQAPFDGEGERSGG